MINFRSHGSGVAVFAIEGGQRAGNELHGGRRLWRGTQC